MMELLQSYTLPKKYMVQNEWNIYYCNYNINHFIYIIKTMNVFNTFFLCMLKSDI